MSTGDVSTVCPKHYALGEQCEACIFTEKYSTFSIDKNNKIRLLYNRLPPYCGKQKGIISFIETTLTNSTIETLEAAYDEIINRLNQIHEQVKKIINRQQPPPPPPPVIQSNHYNLRSSENVSAPKNGKRKLVESSSSSAPPYKKSNNHVPILPKQVVQPPLPPPPPLQLVHTSPPSPPVIQTLPKPEPFAPRVVFIPDGAILKEHAVNADGVRVLVLYTDSQYTDFMNNLLAE